MNSILIASNIMKRLLKEANAFVFLFFFPILAAVIAVSMFAKPVQLNVGVANISSQNNGVINYLRDTGKYKVEVLDDSNIEESVKNNKIKAGIVFPDKFPSNSGEKIKLISNKNDDDAKTIAGDIQVYLGNVLSGKQPPEIDKAAASKYKYQQSRAAMGIFIMFVLMFSGSAIGLLMEDKHQKTFMRCFCAPLRGYEMMLGQLIANFILGTMQIAIFLLIASLAFKIDWGTSVLNIFLLLTVYLITSVGFSLGLAAFVEDPLKYNIVLSIIASLASTMGGAFFPVESAGKLVNEVANFLPPKWVMDAFSLLQNGSTLKDAGVQLLVLMLCGVVFFTFGVKILKPTINDI